ncbi:serine hydrolase [Dactylosporangium fulvum]|uniref:Class A beta-lactamase-related serine hydrolase n=1 Tax=Dactylosporangium fulvum TaxID=53359 RepID=A0ABY5W6I4_9ACTN|nr:serine hydrolase [Dactylosporangium fulvum]UWP85074.1 class A beta-lactamase-related serine hydrolase [Dactylosporangium fulvum]
MDELLWSVCVRGRSGAVLYEQDAARVLSTASVGKLLLLLEVARRIDDGSLAADEPLRRTAPVADSGIWQHLAVDTLGVEDLAVLVGAVSDNLATNVLLDRVGLDAVQTLGTRLGLRDTALHDRVRDVRTPADAPRLSSGSALELSRLMLGIHRGEYAGAARVLGWLRNNTDLSMVAAAFDLDPLAHDGLWNKTGTDTGVRADTGVVDGVAYAVVANYAGDRTGEVLRTMRALGRIIRDLVDR